MAAPAAFINPSNPFKSVAGPTWAGGTSTRNIATTQNRQAGLSVPPMPGMLTLPGQGPVFPPPAPVQAQSRSSMPSFGGGETSITANMGSHFNQRFDGDTGQWVPLKIDATPGDAPSPNANPLMGSMDNFNRLQDPNIAHATQMPMRGFKEGGVTDPGETALVGENGPEIIRGRPDGSVAVLPNDISKPFDSVPDGYTGTAPPAPQILSLHPDPRYTRPGSRPNFSEGANGGENTAYQNYGPNPADALRNQMLDAKSKGLLTPEQYDMASSSIDRGEAIDSIREKASQAFQHNAAVSKQATPYAIEPKARADLAAAKANGIPDQPDTGLSEQDMPPSGLAQPQDSSVPAAPVQGTYADAPAAPFMMNGAVQPSSSPAPLGNPSEPPPPAPVFPQPNAAAAGAAARVAGQANAPGPPLGLIPDPKTSPMDAWNKARNPQREQTAINRFVRSHPLAMPQADIQREVKRVEMNREAEKFNAETLQKQAESLRKEAHNIAQENHWDNAITGKNAVDAAKLKETARKEHEKRVGEASDLSDALGNVQTRAGMLSKSDAKHDEKAAMLSHIMSQKTAKGVAAGIKYYDETFPRAPEEMTIGGQKGVVAPPNSFHWVPQPAVPKGTSKGKPASSYYE